LKYTGDIAPILDPADAGEAEERETDLQATGRAAEK